jgi:transposase
VGRSTPTILNGIQHETLLTIIREKVVPDSIVYTGYFNSYNVLDVSEFEHFRIDHTDSFVTERRNHINGIENFWN